MGEAQSDRRVKDSMNNLELYERVRAVPDDAKKPINAGRLKGMTDINPMWRIKKLTEEFGPCGIGWWTKVTDRWTETVGDETCAFVDLELYIKVGDEWSKPITGSGGSKLATKERSGIYVSDECYKMAETDALSVACKKLGIGADVYFSADRTKYSQPVDDSKKIGANDVKILMDYLQKNGISGQKILERYRVKALSDLTQKRYIEITDKKYLQYFQKECGIEK